MTIQAQAHTLAGPAPNPLTAERPTIGITARNTVCVDAFALLDHRTQARCLPREDVPQGRYLEAEHEDDVRLIPLDRPIVHIGRGLASDIRIEDLEVSRHHAIVAQRGDGVRILDDRSRNGTFVNGRPVTVAYLSDGDVLRLGRVVFRFIEIESPREAVRPLRRIGVGVRGGRSVIADSAA
jgi:hypothetical protein